jgi:hypothetical protein
MLARCYTICLFGVFCRLLLRNLDSTVNFSVQDLHSANNT